MSDTRGNCLVRGAWSHRFCCLSFVGVLQRPLQVRAPAISAAISWPLGAAGFNFNVANLWAERELLMGEMQLLSCLHYPGILDLCIVALLCCSWIWSSDKCMQFIRDLTYEWGGKQTVPVTAAVGI